MRQKIAGLVHHMNRRFAVRNSNMDVQSENQVCARKRLHVAHDFLIAFAFGDELVSPVRKWMGPDRCDLQSAAAGEVRQLAPQLNHMRARVIDRIANLGAEFDDRLMHLGLDLLLEQDLATLEDFLNVRLQLARLRIDNRKLLFDTEGVGVLLLGHWSPKSLSKTWRCHQVDRPLRRAVLINAASPHFKIELATGRVRPQADNGLLDPDSSTNREADVPSRTKRACLTNVSSPRPGD